MPAFALENLVQRGAGTDRWRHCAQYSRVCFFLECAPAQEFLHIFFARESSLGLIVERRFLPFFRRFHATNSNLRARNFVPPTIQPARNGVFVNRQLCAEVLQLLAPTLCVALFRFCHAQENALSFLVALALSEIAIGLRGLDFRLPVTLRCFDRLSILFVAHTPQSAGSSAALIGGSTRALSCCAVITSATEPMMRPPAINVRMVKVSPAKSVPNNTATIGFTYA